MRKGTSITVALALVAAALFGGVTAGAYERYGGVNNCDQCHPTFDGMGTLHTVHTAFVPSCTDCHGSIGDNPLVSKCAECHDSFPLKRDHVNAGLVDDQGLDCSACHSLVPAERWSWGDAKRRFR